MNTPRKIAILGAGESGVGSAVLAIKQGYEVLLSDMGTIKEKYKKRCMITVLTTRKINMMKLGFYQPMK